MPGANPVTTVISAVFFLDGQCQAWIETLCANVHGEGGGQREEEELPFCLGWQWDASWWRTADAGHKCHRLSRVLC